MYLVDFTSYRKLSYFSYRWIMYCNYTYLQLCFCDAAYLLTNELLQAQICLYIFIYMFKSHIGYFKFKCFDAYFQVTLENVF